MNKKILLASGMMLVTAGSSSAFAFNNNGVMGGVVPFFQIVVGFTDDVWTAMTGNIPGFIEKAGLVSRMNKVRDIMAASISTSCANIPTSGTATASDGGTLTYGVPSHSSPASFTKTGAFDKKVTYVGTYQGADGVTYTLSDTKEFYCDGSSANYDALAVRNAAGTLQGQFETFYEKTATITNFQAFIPAGSVGSSTLAFALKIVPADTKFSLWVAQSNNSGGLYGGYRVAAATNYSTQKTSLYYTELGTSQACAATSKAAFVALDWAKSTEVSTTNSGTTAQQTCTSGVTNFTMQGCMANFDATASDVTSNALCTGLDLSAPPVPGIDSTATLNMSWVAGTMESKIFTP
jgi:hypothetical protein